MEELKTLVLNASYEILKVVSWKSAIKSLFLEKVEILEEYDTIIRSPSSYIRVPAVIRHKSQIKIKITIPKFSRSKVYLRDNFTCQFCGEQLSQAKLTIDHILPRSRGGKNSWLNCICCCFACNSKKGNKTPEEAGMQLIKTPMQPTYFNSLLMRLSAKFTNLPNKWKAYLNFKFEG